jgi:Tol biopolymer transport system component
MPEATDRLDSWKQIAAYLQKSERTVRRWHESEGLPVHKHLHQQRGSVWAFPGEVDAWLEQRRVRPAPMATDAPPKAHLERAAVILGVALATGSVFLLHQEWPVPAASRLADPITLTAMPGEEYGPSFSPDAKRVAFYWRGAGWETAGIYVKTVGSEAVTPLVLSGMSRHFVYGPVWSPDGATIAFLRRTPARETWLCLVSASGGPDKRLIRLNDREILLANNRHLSWSLDSRRILAPLQAGERQWAIHWIDVADAATQRVSEAISLYAGPVVSPDRRSLVFLRKYPNAEEELVLWELTPSGSAKGAPQPLFKGRGITSGVAWAPGGRDLIVCKAESGYGGSRLYRVPARPGAQLEAISPAECNSVDVSTPDEKGRVALAYGSHREPNIQLWKASLKDLEHGHSFAPSSRSDSFASFSPDGSSVAFRSTRSGAPAAWVANRDGSQPRRISSLLPALSPMEWSPDGSQILFGSAQVGLAIVPVIGGTGSVIATGNSLPASPHWSHGNGLIYYTTAYRLFQIRPDGSGRAPVGDHGRAPSVAVSNSRTSPDGKTIFLTRLEGLFKRPATGEGEEELIEPKLSNFSLSATRTALYYLRRDDNALYALPFAGGAARRIGTLRGLAEFHSNFSVSPDDTEVVWTLGESREIDLEMVTDFR